VTSDRPSGPTPSTQSQVERFHALDAVRGITLLLVIVLHASMSFTPGIAYTGWPVVDSNPSSVIGLILFTIHLFCMPVFFLLAGFFTSLQLTHQSTREFVKQRTKRIFVAFLLGWTVVVPVTFVFIATTVIPILGRPASSMLPENDLIPAPLLHLWFLWLLSFYYLVFVAARSLSTLAPHRAVSAFAAGAERAMSWICRRNLEPLILALPLATCLFAARSWVPSQGIPTPSNSLVPDLSVVVGYAVAFGFGWFLHGHTEVMARWRNNWKTLIVLAIAAMTVMIAIGGFDAQSSFELVNGTPTLIAVSGWKKLVCALGCGLAAWFLTLGLIGAALRFMDAYNARRRYLADASYWMYIIHFPLIVGLQTLVARWPLHWALKYAIVLGVALPILLGSYRYLVRPTWIGALLNGRRIPRSQALPHNTAT